MTETLKSLTDRAGRLKAERRLDEAVAVHEQAVRAYPSSAVAEHNLAGALGEAGRHAEAETHARTAMAKGLDAPETWLVLARSLQALGRHDEAGTAYRETLKRRPAMLDAQLELAQLIWMRTGDAAAALERIDADVGAMPREPGLRFIRGRILEFIECPAAGYAAFAEALKLWPQDVGLLVPAAGLAVQAGEAAAGAELAVRALRLAPGHRGATEAHAYAALALGRPDEAAKAAAALRASAPADQHALALQATAWRALGDARYRALYDYERFVRPYSLTAPEGWGGVDAYLADLSAALRTHHPYRTHPFGQSVRQGSQLADLLSVDDPAIRAFPEALRPAVDAHLAHLGRADDPLTLRNTGRWRFDGIWSVWLKPGGFHADHVHPNGWLSSACYVELPPAIGAGGREGWIKFGEPGLPVTPRMEAEHVVRPEPGRVVLFPSYMWHGTIPFTGEKLRLTIAFDIVPD